MEIHPERVRGKRGYYNEERLHHGRDRIEHPTPPFGDVHPELERIRKLMEEAIREAIEDANLPQTRYRASNGELRWAQGGTYRYDFHLETLWEIDDDTRIKLQVDPHDPRKVVDGTVIETDGVVISLATEIPLTGSALQVITMFEDKSWLLQKLLDAVKTLQETLSQMGAKSFGIVACLDHELSTEKLPNKIGRFIPDDDQRKAIEYGLLRNVLRLIGPPGTGKTKTLSAQAWYYLSQGKKILLLAHTNVAVDNAVASLQELCQDTQHVDWLIEHRIVRIGNSRELDTEAYRDVLHGVIVDQEMGWLAAKSEVLKQEDGQMLEEQALLKQALEHKKKEWKSLRRPLVHRLQDVETQLSEVNALIGETRVNIEQEIKAKQQERADIQQVLKPLEASEAQIKKRYEEEHRLLQEVRSELASVEREIAQVEKLNWIWRFFYVRRETLDHKQIAWRKHLLGYEIRETYDLEEEKTYARLLRESINSIDRTLQRLERERNATQLKKSEPLVMLKKVGEREAELQQMLADHPSDSIRNLRAQHEQERDQIAAELRDGESEISSSEQRVEQIRFHRMRIRESLQEIEQESRLVKEQVAANAVLIAATLTSVFTSPYLKGRYFDCVIIDEASIAALPMILVAAARATEHVIIIGDPLQLAPIPGLNNERKFPKAREWFGTDLFSYLGITLEQAERGEKQTVFLSKQSRMDPDIARPVSEYIYQGLLKNRERPGYTRRTLEPLPEKAWLVVDTSDEPTCQFKRPANKRSKYNEYHLCCDLQIVKRLMDSMPDAMYANHPNISIITPYAPQVRKIRAALFERGWDRWVRVGTIHAYQGREFEAVIVDFVEAPPEDKNEKPIIPRFTSDVWGHKGIATQATRLINVAHSRAREKLIYVANVQYHRDHSSERHVLMQFINAGIESGRIASRELWQ